MLYEHYYADTAQIYHDKRRRNCYKRDPLKHYAVFLKMLSKRFKAKFDATSIDEFVGEFKRLCQAIHVLARLLFIAILIVGC